MNANGMGLARLTNDPGFDGAPTWSADGTKIAFISNRSGSPLVGGTTEVYVMNADGSRGGAADVRLGLRASVVARNRWALSWLSGQSLPSRAWWDRRPIRR